MPVHTGKHTDHPSSDTMPIRAATLLNPDLAASAEVPLFIFYIGETAREKEFNYVAEIFETPTQKEQRLADAVVIQAVLSLHASGRTAGIGIVSGDVVSHCGPASRNLTEYCPFHLVAASSD